MARKEKIFHYIYKTTNILNGKYYYGMHSTDNLEDGYLGSGKRLRRSINKHGAENHKTEILEFFSNRKALSEREKEIITLNEVAKEDCMNIAFGGEGGYLSLEGCKRGGINSIKIHQLRYNTDEEYRNYVTEKRKEEIEKRKSAGTFKTWGDYYDWTGKHHSDETKKIMSLKANERTGNKNSQFGSCWITNGIENKKMKKFDTIPNGWNFGRIFLSKKE
jgi:hypothetical protein